MVFNFEGDGVVSTVHVGMLHADMEKLMDMFAIGELVRVKCRMGFSEYDRSLSLRGEEVDLISNVKVVIVVVFIPHLFG